MLELVVEEGKSEALEGVGIQSMDLQRGMRNWDYKRALLNLFFSKCLLFQVLIF